MSRRPWVLLPVWLLTHGVDPRQPRRHEDSGGDWRRGYRDGARDRRALTRPARSAKSAGPPRPPSGGCAVFVLALVPALIAVSGLAAGAAFGAWTS